MNLWEEYRLAPSVQDALSALAQSPGPAQVIAGGTDLLLDLQQGRHPPVHTLVDLSAIPEMTALEIRGERLYIGAARPLNQVVSHPLVQKHVPALYEAAGLIGGPQVRNTATLGGNVGHALPAADGAIALLALDAQAEVASLAGRRERPLQSLFAGPGQSALDLSRELIVGFYLPLRLPGQASAFQRVMRPQGVAIAILNLAVWLWRREDRIQSVRMAVGPAGKTPTRATTIETLLTGQKLTPDLIGLAQAAIARDYPFRSSPHRAGAEYRRNVAAVLLQETMEKAWLRAAPERVGEWERV